MFILFHKATKRRAEADTEKESGQRVNNTVVRTHPKEPNRRKAPLQADLMTSTTKVEATAPGCAPPFAMAEGEWSTASAERTRTGEPGQGPKDTRKTPGRMCVALLFVVAWP